MRNILIIYPHWPPSNLAGMHRPRLLANFLPEFGWQPIVLAVNPDFYEEAPDHDLLKTVSDKVRVHQVSAFRLNRKISFIGDIGIRAFYHLYKGALKIIDQQKIDFIFIPIPSFYTAVLGRILFERRKISYGIDYIDPWVQYLPSNTKKLSKAWLTNQLAKILEPIAVKKATLITGVASSYYQPVLDSHFKNRPIAHVGMPYGFDPSDHGIQLEDVEFPWSHIKGCKALVYAGAFLPQSHLFIEILFKSIKAMINNQDWDSAVHIFFLGTGNYPGKSIDEYAQQFGIKSHVHEINKRFPYLRILNFLSKASGVLIIGSTEKHYTASKTFQALLSKSPILAIMHKESSAVNILKDLKASQYLVEYDEDIDLNELEKSISDTLKDLIKSPKVWLPDLSTIDKYSAKHSAKLLAEKLNSLVHNKD